MTDTRERFLREIAERLPPERVSELHLFPPLRQGGIESGVAVVAAEPDADPTTDAGVAKEGEGTRADDVQAAEPRDAFADREVELRAEADDERAGRTVDEVGPEPELATVAEASAESGANADGVESGASADNPDVADTADAAETQLTLGDALAEPACDPTDDAAGPPPARARPRRHTVYTARYRHTLKGPDRGKWEFDLVAEADAPLVTVETVVRGVQKRIGEIADPERLTPDELRTALDDTPWRATTG